MPGGRITIPKVRAGQRVRATHTNAIAAALNRTTQPNRRGFQGENLSVFLAPKAKPIATKFVVLTETVDAANWDGNELTVSEASAKTLTASGTHKYQLGAEVTAFSYFVTEIQISSGKGRIAALNERCEIFNVDCEEIDLP